MKVGIVGFSGSGKTSLFNALTGQAAPTGNYGAGKINLGAIRVPDSRLDRLAEIYEPKKVTFAEITCVDVPGPPGGQGAALDSTTLEALRDVSALALIIGSFLGTEPDPVAAFDMYLGELLLADQVLVERRIEKAEKLADRKTERALLEKLLVHLQAEKPLFTLPVDPSEEVLLRQYTFASDKPLVVAINVAESALGDARFQAAADALQQRGYPAFVLCCSLEADLAAMEPEDRQAFLADLGLKETARDRFIRATYETLSLITFLTAGEKEVRCWPVRKGWTAKQAAGRIHSDLERGFIRAEVFHFNDIDAAGDEAAIKASGKFRVEGKDYIVKDGDVMLIRHSG